MKLGICVGHSRRGDMGAVSTWGESEWDYNLKVARELQYELVNRGIDSFIIASYNADTYGAGIRDCARILKEKGATHAVELHFNSASSTAHGSEWLHWHSSTGGKRLAESIQAGFAQSFPQMRDRGVKALDAGSRGSLFLRATHCPAVILEPFFGSNDGDSLIFEGNEKELAEAYAEGIARHSP